MDFQLDDRLAGAEAHRPHDRGSARERRLGVQRGVRQQLGQLGVDSQPGQRRLGGLGDARRRRLGRSSRYAVARSRPHPVPRVHPCDVSSEIRLLLVQLASEFVQTAGASRPDRADRNIQRGGDLLVGRGLRRTHRAAAALGNAPRSRETRAHSASSRSCASSRSSIVSPLSDSNSHSSSDGISRLPIRMIRRHSRRAVVANHAPSRSGSSIRSRFSTSRSHVLCAASAASAALRRWARVVDQTSPEKRSTISFQAAWLPLPASLTNVGSSTDTGRQPSLSCGSVTPAATRWSVIESTVTPPPPVINV